MDSEETDARVGTVFDGRYHIARKLGPGDEANTYLATDRQLKREVTLKILVREGNNEVAAKRFVREQAIMGRLKHPHIVEVFDAGETADGELYLASEVVKGRTLARQIKQHGPLEPERAAHIAAQIASALAAAHQANVLHRDLKPNNIRIVSHEGDTDFVKVLDFGIARFFEEDENEEQLTAAGKVIGTPHYMSPEQIASKPLDPRADLYTLGCLLFFLLTGRTPFVGKTFEVMRQHAFDKPPTPSAVSGRPVPSAIESVVMGLLEKDPDKRPTNAQHVADMLKRASGVRGEGVPSAQGVSFEDLPESGDDTIPESDVTASPPPGAPLAKTAGFAALGFSVVLGVGALIVAVVLLGAAWVLLG
jgi:serine/threonine-protein kinase